jgi:alpha-beta hydrolase superfamily lysophospholipase
MNKSVSTRMKVTAVSLLSVSSLFLPVKQAESASLPSSIFDNFVLRPIKYAKKYTVKQVAGVKAQDCFFPSSNGRMLHGWYFHLPNAERTILLSHGIGGNVSSRVDLIDLYLKAGTSVFIYDYQGYGRSGGSASFKNIVEDGTAAYNYLTQELAINPNELILAGESLGTGVSCALSTRVKAAALILQSPFSSLAKRVSEVVPFFKNKPEWLQPTSGLENDLVLSHSHLPVLIVHGDRDTTIPVSHAENLYKSAIGEKQLLIIPGAGHTGDPALMQSPEYLDAVKHFVNALTPGAPLNVSQTSEEHHHISVSMPLL